MQAAPAQSKPEENKQARTEWNAISEPSKFPDQVNAQHLIFDKFPFTDRMMMKMCLCCFKSESFSKQMLNEKPHLKFEEEYKKPDQQVAGIKIRIKGTGSLQLDPNVLCPFVRMHILDLNTWKPLAKSKRDRPGVSHFESVQVTKADGKLEQKEADYLMPIATKFFDMRISGQNQCQWNEEFIINECAPNILKENVVFLFEILEVNSQLIKDRQFDKLTAELFYPVAWAYLRPVGTAMTHMARTRLQLYKYKFNYTSDLAKKWPYDARTPAVFFDFEFPRKTQYPSYLEVDLQFCKRSETTIERRHISRAPWEKEIDKTRYTGVAKTVDPDEPKIMPQSDMIKFEKFVDQPSMLPDTRLKKLDTDS